MNSTGCFFINHEAVTDSGKGKNLEGTRSNPSVSSRTAGQAALFTHKKSGNQMFVLSNLLKALATIIDLTVTVYIWIVIGRAVISWVNPDPYNPIVRFLQETTEPVLARIRRVVPLFGGGIDFTPMILILGLIFLRSFLVPTLRQMAMVVAG